MRKRREQHRVREQNGDPADESNDFTLGDRKSTNCYYGRYPTKDAQPMFADQTKCGSSPSRSFVATSTASTVAVLRTFPAIVISASDTAGCRSASPSRRALTS